MNGIERERNLIERARHGDRAAFNELASSASGTLLPRIQRRIGAGLQGVLDTEDVIQETFFRAFQSMDKFRWQGEGSFESWLHGIALKIILHVARERGKWNLLRINREPQADESKRTTREFVLIAARCREVAFVPPAPSSVATRTTTAS